MSEASPSALETHEVINVFNSSEIRADYRISVEQGVKLIFTGDHYSLVVAFTGPK